MSFTCDGCGLKRDRLFLARPRMLIARGGWEALLQHLHARIWVCSQECAARAPRVHDAQVEWVFGPAEAGA